MPARVKISFSLFKHRGLTVYLFQTILSTHFGKMSLASKDTAGQLPPPMLLESVNKSILYSVDGLTRWASKSFIA